MKKIVVGLMALFVLTGCAEHGWKSLPVDENGDCFQITKWKSDGWSTQNQGLGTYCKAEVTQ